MPRPSPELARLARACAGQGGARVVVDAALVALAQAEEVLPLLGARVAEGAVDVPDPAARATLVAGHRAAAAVVALVERETAPLLAALGAAGIPALLLKGAALWRTVYAPGERLARDLDLLVPGERFAEARRVAGAAGLVEDVPRATYPLTMAVYHQVELRTPGGLAVDLHRRVSPWPLWPVDHDALFARARPAGPPGGGGALVPEPSDALAMLAVHVAQDGFAFPLRTALDGLRLAAPAGGATPEAVADRARAWQARRAVAAFLRVLVALGAAPAWSAAAEALAGGAALPPWRAPGAKGEARRAAQAWRDRAALARACDGAARPALYFAARGMLRAGDRVTAALARR
jgi:hypothetical protein